MTKHISHESQLGFDALLSSADEDNERRRFERETGHLPNNMEEGLRHFRDLLERHHAAMLDADVGLVMTLRDEADKLALRLNGGDRGILADDDSAGCVLERLTAAPIETIPLWGQLGEFTVEISGMKVRIELDGVFGIASGVSFWPGFSSHAVDMNRPFLSETGYRSFLGIYAEPVSGMTPDSFVREVIARHVAQHLKGKLLVIVKRWRKANAD